MIRTVHRRNWRGRTLRLAVVAFLGVVAMLVAASPASAHPVLLFSDPALDGAVPDSPGSVNLVFNEPVVSTDRAVAITDSSGSAVPTSPPRTEKGGTVLTASVTQKLEPGIYQVQWEATGVDGHGARGEYRFAVGTVITGDQTASTSQPTDWPAAGLRWLLLAGFAVAFGGLVGERITSRAGRRHAGLPSVCSWAQLGALLGLFAATAAAARLALRAESISVLWESAAGRVVLAHALGFGVALLLLALRRPSYALLPLLVVALAEGVGSHSEIELPVGGGLLTAVHLVAAGIWVGALLHVARAAVKWRASRAAVQWALLRYAQIATISFVVIVVTGLTMALLLVPLPALTGTGYGRSLLVKLAAVVAVVGMALAARRALRSERLGRATRTARFEAVTLVVVLGVTSVLVSTPTPGAFSAPPPPPPTGVAVPAGGLAGQVGVNLVASEGQVVVRLTTPSDGNEYDVSEAPDYTLSAQLQSATGTQEPVEFRACGEGCFVAALDWADGDNVLNLRATASGWRGGNVAALVPWPAEPAEDLLERTLRVLDDFDQVTIYEAVTSDGEAGLPQPSPATLSMAEFLEGEPYSAGVAPIAARSTADSGATKLLMGFPSAGTYVEVTLDGLGRISQEVLAAPSHSISRRFFYKDD